MPAFYQDESGSALKPGDRHVNATRSREPDPELWRIYLQILEQAAESVTYLPLLLRLARQCDDVVTLGARQTASVTALLCGQPHRLRVYDPARQPSIVALEQYACACSFQCEPLNPLTATLEATDLLLIDTFRTSAHLTAELNRHAPAVTKWIIVLDTTTYGFRGEDRGPGLWPAVEACLGTNPDWFLAVRLNDTQGLAILQHRSLAISLSEMLELFGGPCELIVPGSHRECLFLHPNGQIWPIGQTRSSIEVRDASILGSVPQTAKLEFLSAHSGACHQWRFDGPDLIVLDHVGTPAIRFQNLDHLYELRGETLSEERDPVQLRHTLRPPDDARMSPPRIGIVIGSYQQPLWVRANVAAIRQFAGKLIPILIVDDLSSLEHQQQLVEIAEEFGCQLQVNLIPLGHYPGDVRTILSGLEWAADLGCSHLFKFSQRTICVRPGWALELAQQMQFDGSAVAYQTQTDTQEIRTEFLGLHVPDWQAPTVTDALVEPIDGLFETWFYRLCWKHFPWRHTPIPWLSRSRFQENPNIISYYAMGFDSVQTLYEQLTGQPLSVTRSS